MAGETIPLDCIVNGVTVCAVLGMSKSYVSTMINRGSAGFPKPLDTPGVAGIPLWDIREIVKWRDDPARRAKSAGSVNVAYIEKFI